jgi:hypothetical protein
MGIYGCGGHALGLDVSESRRSYEDYDDDDFEDDFANIPHATSSMDTVPSSNITPHPTPSKPKSDHTKNDDTNNCVSTDQYADESGGLQAILESRLTPRHRNCQQNLVVKQPHHQPSGVLSDFGSIADSSSILPSQTYQRTPPTLPDLPSNKTRE